VYECVCVFTCHISIVILGAPPNLNEGRGIFYNENISLSLFLSSWHWLIFMLQVCLSLPHKGERVHVHIQHIHFSLEYLKINFQSGTSI